LKIFLSVALLPRLFLPYCKSVGRFWLIEFVVSDSV
jgi:hypothetical protein